MKTRAADDPSPGIRFFPRLAAGVPRPLARSVEDWVRAAWLLAVEGRALIEDLEGGENQEPMRRVVGLKLLELLAEVDTLLAGATPPDEVHRLALALEYGLTEVAAVDGGRLIELFGLEQSAASRAPLDDLMAFWQRLLDEFPGELPNPLVAAGQSEILKGLQSWSKLCQAAGVDASFLKPLMKKA